MNTVLKTNLSAMYTV